MSFFSGNLANIEPSSPVAVTADEVRNDHLPPSAVMRMKRRVKTDAGGDCGFSFHFLLASAFMPYVCADGFIIHPASFAKSMWIVECYTSKKRITKSQDNYVIALVQVCILSYETLAL